MSLHDKLEVAAEKLYTLWPDAVIWVIEETEAILAWDQAVYIKTSSGHWAYIGKYHKGHHYEF